MSRFKPSATQPRPARPAGPVAPPRNFQPPLRPGAAPAAALPFQTLPFQVRTPSLIAPALNAAQKVAFLALLIFVFSQASLINEVSQERLGVRPYSTTIAGPIMALALVASGNLFRGLRNKSGWLWLIMILCMTASLPFSVWRSDSLSQWLQYVVKIYPLFFFICAAAVTVRLCERLLYAMILAGVVVTVIVSVLGHDAGGRFIMGRGTFANPNALALQVILGACSFIYLIYHGKRPWPLVAMAGIAVCSLLVFRSGSRAGFLAVLCAIAALFFTMRQAGARFKMLAVVAILGISAIFSAAINPVAFRRLTDIAFSDRAPERPDELFAGSSQMAREELLRKAVELTLSHPLLGVGLGEFPVAVDVAARAEGQKSSWNGTHNTFLQVSSECGIPAAICYLAVLLISIRTSRRLYREFSLKPGGERIAGIALTLFTSLVALSVALMFFHTAYSYYVPLLCGLTCALNAAAQQERLAAAPAR